MAQQMNMGPKQNHASSLIIEDHLKMVLSKTKDKCWKASDNPNLPRAHHSAFGDFPKDYMPAKTKQADQAGATMGDTAKRSTHQSKSTAY